MITRITIENYKSIRKLDLELGRLNVFIGENGCGKTNILEAVALGSAAAQGRLANEFLAARGIRVTAADLMRSAFETDGPPNIVVVSWMTEEPTRFTLTPVETPAGIEWLELSRTALSEELSRALAHRAAILVDEPEVHLHPDTARRILELLSGLSTARRDARAATATASSPQASFLLYAPENSFLRRFEEEGQILPLGSKGEGLLAHLQSLAAQQDAPAIGEINEHLSLLDWFETLQVPDKDQAGRALRIRDRYLPEGIVFDQRSANEGFLFLLFYFTLFASPHTPKFFAIDNVDASLNPKMCAALMRSMVDLAKKHDKQAIVTTHNPSLLDGLDLTDDEQRLFVVSRGVDGDTRIHRVEAPRSMPGTTPVLLSEAFTRGYIGGLPKNF